MFEVRSIDPELKLLGWDAIKDAQNKSKSVPTTVPTRVPSTTRSTIPK
jgi:hypothetical protein